MRANMRTLHYSLAVAAMLLPALAAPGQNTVSVTVTRDGAGTEQRAEQWKRMAVVEFSADFMREEPDYAAELGNQALMGTVVEIVDRKGYWVKVKSPDPYTAWVTDMGLIPMDEKELEDYLEAPKYICTAMSTRIFEEPSTESRIVSEFVLGDIVRIMYESKVHRSGRLKGVEEGRAVLRKHFAGVVLPSGKTGYVPAEDVAVFYRWAKEKRNGCNDEDSFRESLVRTALGFLGVPYMWGGTSAKNVDCSGLTRCVYFSNGILLPRNASQQARTGKDVRIFNGNGDVDWNELLPGDLLFWGKEATDSTAERISHVGMYIGGGRFIHSAQVVRTSSLDPSAPDYYDRKPVRARRIVGCVSDDRAFIFKNPNYFPQERE